MMPAEEIQSSVVEYPGGCRVSGKGEGLALRGFFLLFLIPLGLWIIWKRRRK